MLRLSDSDGDGALELADETDATLLVVGWSGPRMGVEQLFGSELDRIRSTSPVPTAAAHLTGSWDRVIVVPGAQNSPWQEEDVRLTLEVAARLTAHGSAQLPLLVIADDEEQARTHLGARAHEFVRADRPGDVMVSMLKPTDLVVAPSYLLSTMSLPRRLRLSSALAQQNLVIVAAPGRSTSTGARPAHAVDGLLGQHS